MFSASSASPKTVATPGPAGAGAPQVRRVKDPESGLTRQDYIEQYKAYLSDLGNIGTRYATLQGFYVSVISALMGILALTESSKLMGGIPVRTMAVACGFSSALCWLWFLTIGYYRRLFLAKITVLKKIEEYLPLNCFAMEWDQLTEPGSKRPVLLKIEQWLPVALIILFVSLFTVRALV